MQEEIWRDIPGYEGIYQVSDKGRVRRLGRIEYMKNGVSRYRKGLIMKFTMVRGYLQCGLRNNITQRMYRVHQLVAMAFLNHTPAGHSMVVDHINNIPTDNRLENLQIISNRYNLTKDKKGTSKHPGVSWRSDTKKWRACIRLNGRVNNLGSFKDESEAAIAYQNALKELDELIPKTKEL